MEEATVRECVMHVRVRNVKGMVVVVDRESVLQ